MRNTFTSRLNQYEGTFQQLKDQASYLLRDLDQTISYQEDAIQLLTGRADEIQQTLQATHTEMQQLKDEQHSLSTGLQQLREQQESMGNTLMSQMHQIIERLDCQPALAPRNPWGFGSFGPSSSHIPGSKPSGALRGNSAPQPAITLEAEPTPSPLKDPRLGVNRSAPIQVVSPPTILIVSYTLGAAGSFATAHNVTHRASQQVQKKIQARNLPRSSSVTRDPVAIRMPRSHRQMRQANRGTTDVNSCSVVSPTEIKGQAREQAQLCAHTGVFPGHLGEPVPEGQ